VSNRSPSDPAPLRQLVNGGYPPRLRVLARELCKPEASAIWAGPAAAAMLERLADELDAALSASAVSAQTPQGERRLCAACGGNGVVKIPGGVSVCDRCHGDCWEPPAAVRENKQLRAALERLLTEISNAADSHIRGGGFHEERGKGMLDVAHDLKRILNAHHG
jgi:hypothetical protein